MVKTRKSCVWMPLYVICCAFPHNCESEALRKQEVTSKHGAAVKARANIYVDKSKHVHIDTRAFAKARINTQASPVAQPSKKEKIEQGYLFVVGTTRPPGIS